MPGYETKGICEFKLGKPWFDEVCLWLDQRKKFNLHCLIHEWNLSDVNMKVLEILLTREGSI
jgi:hypothetical protein